MQGHCVESTALAWPIFSWCWHMCRNKRLSFIWSYLCAVFGSVIYLMSNAAEEFRGALCIYSWGSRLLAEPALGLGDLMSNHFWGVDIMMISSWYHHDIIMISSVTISGYPAIQWYPRSFDLTEIPIYPVQRAGCFSQLLSGLEHLFPSSSLDTAYRQPRNSTAQSVEKTRWITCEPTVKC